MRLWHIDLIHILPEKQLLGQWRELVAISGSIKKNGTPNHVLVNWVMDYDYDNFISYAYIVKKEMKSRGYKVNSSSWDKIVSLKPSWYHIPAKWVYYEIMDNNYKSICLYNLYEKLLRLGKVSKRDKLYEAGMASWTESYLYEERRKSVYEKSGS